MKNVDHTHPHTDEAFGQTQTFRRGVVIAADGGEADAESESDTIGDVGHESPTDGTKRAFERGTEGRTDTV
jgi:hypothetical protein